MAQQWKHGISNLKRFGFMDRLPWVVKNAVQLRLIFSHFAQAGFQVWGLGGPPQLQVVLKKWNHIVDFRFEGALLIRGQEPLQRLLLFGDGKRDEVSSFFVAIKIRERGTFK